MTTQQILQGVHDWTNGKIVYDISVAHPDGQGNPTPYADLTAALGNGGANIPKPLRKGGMSVKFIKGSAHSSDNKYVQYRYIETRTSTTYFTNVSNWELEVTKKTLSDDFLGLLSEIKDFPIKDYSILDTGKFGGNASYDHAALAVTAGEVYYLIASSNLVKVAFATSDAASSGGDIPMVSGTSVISMPQVNQYYKFVIPQGCTYLLFNASGTFGTKCFKHYDSLKEGTNDYTDNQPIPNSDNLIKSGSVFSLQEGQDYTDIVVNGGENTANSVKGNTVYTRYIYIKANIGDVVTLTVNRNDDDVQIHCYEQSYGVNDVLLKRGSIDYTVRSNITRFFLYASNTTNDKFDVSASITKYGIENKINDVETEIDSIKEEIDESGLIIGVQHNIHNWSSGYIKTDGELKPANNAFHSGYIPISENCIVTVNSPASAAFSAIAFYKKVGNNYIFVEGVPGTGVTAYSSYSYITKENGYIVFSISTFAFSDAKDDTTYIVDFATDTHVDLDYVEDYSRKAFQKTENYVEPWKAVLIGSAAKYFTTTNLKLVVDAMVSAGLNKLVCQIFSDRGFRWSLNTDDNNPSEMVITVDGITYDLTNALGEGMSGGDGSNMWVTRAEMDDFLDYCNTNHIDFIPCFSMPSHMGAILKEFPSLAYSTTYNNILNLKNQHCCDVGHAILDTFLKYFGSKKVNRVIIGGDEMREVFAVNKKRYFDYQNESIDVAHYYDMIPVIWNDYMLYTGKNGLLQNKNTEVIHWNGTSDANNTPEYTIDLGYNVINANMHGLYWILGESSHITAEQLRTYNHFNFDRNHIISDNYRKHCLGSMVCFWTDDGDAHGADGGSQMVTEITPLITAFGEGIAEYNASNILNVECTNAAMFIESGRISFIDIAVPSNIKINNLISGTVANNAQLQICNLTNISANVVGGYISNGNVRLWFTNISDNTISINANTSVQLKYL